MIKSIKDTSSYTNLNLNKEQFHAYLLYSNDTELNNEIALCFANAIVCEKHSCCGTCNSCKQFMAQTHPDVFIVNQPSIKVEDANNLISKLSTLPVYNSKKVFIILNAENINEIAQNKLLKSIEEPSNNVLFIFTTTKTDKLLPTIMSRLHKVYIPKLTTEDNILIAKEL
ncbi:MAG: AAA family ATPase, partial [Clostridia bacterium]|nr:AAA family ATPase [Clostridia bacterium]